MRCLLRCTQVMMATRLCLTFQRCVLVVEGEAEEEGEETATVPVEADAAVEEGEEGVTMLEGEEEAEDVVKPGQEVMAQRRRRKSISLLERFLTSTVLLWTRL